jgi:hypothetical protein
MMELWGSDTCDECNIVRNYLGRTPLEWQYVDVKQTNYEGFIPLLIDHDTGQRIEGMGPIKRYCKQKMSQLGIPEGMM